MADYYERERPSFRGRGPKNYQRSDERIREDVCERLTYDERVDASDVEVDVREGVVRLSEVGFDPAKPTLTQTIDALLKSP